jgi:hypothetical protein
MKKILLLISFVLIGFSTLFAQESYNVQRDERNMGDTAKTKKSKEDKNCQPQALGDWIKQVLGKEESKPKPLKDFNALVLPNISSNPTNGFILGVGGALSWYMGSRETTRVSAAGFTVAYTSKNQLISFIKPNIYTKDNKLFLQGDLRFYLYSQPTYGLGTNSPPDTSSLQMPSNFHWDGEGGSSDSIAFPMKFNYVKIHEIVNFKLKENFYAGVGYHLDYYSSIKDTKYKPATDSTPELETPHHYWSHKHGFDSSKYILSGISANILYDSRDNMINAYKGIYANINYRYNFNVLGSSEDASTLWAEFRYYKGLSKKLPRHVIACWFFGDFNLTGNMPYLTLPALGEDQRARSGRGYTNGRYRGKNLVYGEIEYRFPISQCSQILGGVVFVNATTTDNPNLNVNLFQYVQPGIGFGIRVMVNKNFRTNINLDIAIGHKSSGFYFSGQETF